MYKDTNLPLVVVVEAVVVTVVVGAVVVGLVVVVVGIVVVVALSKVKRFLITYFVVTPHSHMHIYLSVCLSILYLISIRSITNSSSHQKELRGYFHPSPQKKKIK